MFHRITSHPRDQQEIFLQNSRQYWPFFFIVTSVALVSISRDEIKEVQSVIDLEKEKDQNKNLPQIPENQK